jgi:L-cystine uptake protein TcyP (sodium:dicarboxylate symporter family)
MIQMMWASLLGFVLVLCLISLIKKQILKNKTKSSLSSINSRVLEEAEKILNESKEDFIPVKNFRTEEGYREENLLEIVAYLSAQGIDAHYTKNSVPLSIIQTFSLMVRTSDLAKAKIALNQR